MQNIEIAVAISAALFFDFVNGFHDSANSIATVVGTRVLRPLYAVGIATIANFAGPFIFGTAVAATVGKGIIQPSFSTVDVIFAGLIGAIIWDLVTWYFGLPSSSSHALIGGLIGSGLVAGGTSALVAPGIEKTLTFLVVSPALGFSCAFGIALLVMSLFQKPDIFACQQAFWPSSNLFFNLFLPYSWCKRRSKDNGSHHCPVDCRGIP